MKQIYYSQPPTFWRNRRGKYATSIKASFLYYQQESKASCLSHTVFTFSQLPGAKSGTGFFHLPPVECWKLLSLPRDCSGCPKAIPAKETSTPGSQISTALSLLQRPMKKEGRFTWLPRNTGTDPILYLLYCCNKLRCGTNRLQSGGKETK